ncbi:MAG: hypothetical protein AW09_003112 [Candidatus Accumulibacter phosphatis]|uniref:Uncharacterized protein n=1 Tax=Candidatus Accumulibacter phosphatis TaxID=327160 RepID=A0A080LTE5_9PROT|nr:MAG: hypothetical protein AW09_003112 [Candidatus Accumulibacter phosphatis]
MKMNAGQLCAEAFETRHKSIAHLIAGAVVQVGRGRRIGIGLQRLQPGEEGRDANATSDPDLPGLWVAAGDIEATIRAFHAYRLSRMKTHGEAVGVVAQRLDLEADDAIAMIGAGDGEGVRTFLVVEGDEGKLPRTMPVPAAIKATDNRGDVVRRMFDGNDLANSDAATADAAKQRMNCPIHAHHQQRGEQPARRLCPVISGREQRGMEGEHQVKHRHGTVQETPGAIGELFPQRDHQHCQQRIDRPFAHVFGQIAQDFEQADEFFLRQAALATDCRFEDVTRQLDQPVHRGKGDGQDAGPLVRAVDPIHAAQRGFQPGRPGRQQHAQRHQGNRQQAAQIERFLAGDP